MTDHRKTTRRAILAGAAAVPAVALAPPLAVAGELDPVFAAIEKLRQAEAELTAMSMEIDTAEGAVNEANPLFPKGCRPEGLVLWRDRCIGGTEIDAARDEFIATGIAAPDVIEREYQLKKYEHRAGLRAGRDWDRKHGLASLRARHRRLIRAVFAAREDLSTVRPTTVAGATALIVYLDADIREFDDFDDWHQVPLENAAAALNSMVVS